MNQAIIGATLTLLALAGPPSTGAGQAAACAPSGGLTFICGVQNPEDLVLVPEHALADCQRHGAGQRAAPRGHAGEDGPEPVSPSRAADARAGPDAVRELPGPARPRAGAPARPEPPAGAGRPLHGVRHQPRRPRIDRGVRARRRGAPRRRRPGSDACRCPTGWRPTASPRSATARSSRRCSSCRARRSTTRSPAAITGAVFLWTPGSAAFRQLPGTELSANNGIETSPDDREFYVVSTTTEADRRLLPGSNPGTPLRTAQLTEFGPGQRSLDARQSPDHGRDDRRRAALRRRRRRPRKASGARAATSPRRSTRRRWPSASWPADRRRRRSPARRLPRRLATSCGWARSMRIGWRTAG